MSLSSQYKRIKSSLPENGMELVAVSKYQSQEAIRELYELGQRTFGESRAQDLQLKHEALPKDIRWHFIGHLQRTNVKYIAPFVTLIHAVDTFRLLEEIDKQAKKCERIIPCLLQIHIAQEESKFGFTFEECRAMLNEGTWQKLTNIRICGMMCMASNTDNEEKIRAEFAAVNTFFNEVKTCHFSDAPHFAIRSWGMSNDYHIAIEEGSNMVRIGSALFNQ